ncbi:MAG: hypothetical protein C5B55_07365 [Blastocatellia bacterium]|nr:MAG: hypothetical protein C5B55_07365 [Blastocatellia bacterium]
MSEPFKLPVPANAAQRSVTIVTYGDCKTAFREAERMALADLAKKRKRLGTLTADQELALENLFSSTASIVCEVATKVLESLPQVINHPQTT